MIPGETILSGASNVCCAKPLPFSVCQSAAGYYVGTWCPRCGPYSRETGYFASREDAAEALERFLNGDFRDART